MALGTWEAISVTELEQALSLTRGAIFYFNKNKADLFANMFDELFFPIFTLSDEYKQNLSRCPKSALHLIYKSPFKRVMDDLKVNYGIEKSSFAVMNIVIQGLKHYPSFKEIVLDNLTQEAEFIMGIQSQESIERLFDLDKESSLKSFFKGELGKMMVDAICF